MHTRRRSWLATAIARAHISQSITFTHMNMIMACHRSRILFNWRTVADGTWRRSWLATEATSRLTGERSQMIELYLQRYPLFHHFLELLIQLAVQSRQEHVPLLLLPYRRLEVALLLPAHLHVWLSVAGNIISDKKRKCILETTCLRKNSLRNNRTVWETIVVLETTIQS